MGDKEAKTLKEWFGDATRGDGRRFKCHDWMTGDWFEPLCWTKGDWVGIDSTGDSFQWGECEDEFELYTEPKKTETRWLWATECGYVCQTYSKEMPIEVYYKPFPVSKSSGITIVQYPSGSAPSRTSHLFSKKLEWSATEFEVE